MPEKDPARVIPLETADGVFTKTYIMSNDSSVWVVHNHQRCGAVPIKDIALLRDRCNQILTKLALRRTHARDT